MKLFKKLLYSIIISLILLFSIALPAFAIADPDTLEINAMWAYRNCIEDDDQLYIVDFTIEYAVPPTENVSQAFLGRLEGKATAPYYYSDAVYDENGYDRGVIAFYFSADDALTWEGSYNVWLEGNPTLTWGADPPATSSGTFALWQDNAIATTRELIASRILWLAEQLEDDWGVDLVESSGEGYNLTAAGEDYFTHAIGNLGIMAPYVFSGSTTAPEIERREFSQSYANTLAGSVTGSDLDVSDMATDFGLSTMWLSSILYLGGVAVLLGYMTQKIHSYKPAVVISIPCILAGALLGLLPLVLAVILGFISLVMTGYVLFYAKASA